MKLTSKFIFLSVIFISLLFLSSTIGAMLSIKEKTKKVSALKIEVSSLEEYKDFLIKELAYRKTREFINKEKERILFENRDAKLPKTQDTKTGPDKAPPFMEWLQVFKI